MNNEQKVLGSRGQDICDRTRAFALVIIETYRSLKKDDVGRVIGKQLLRSGTSIGANVEEAQSAESRKDFVHKMSIALKESRETNYWLTLLADSKTAPIEKTQPIIKECNEIIRVIYTIIRNSKANS